MVYFRYSFNLFLMFYFSIIKPMRSLEDGYCASENSLYSKVCCANFEEINGKCKECRIGFTSNIGRNCIPCANGKYGHKCAGICKCQYDKCDSISGCIDKSDLTVFSVGTSHVAVSTVVAWSEDKIVTEASESTVVTWKGDEIVTELTGRETIFVYLLSSSGVVIFLGIMYACCKIKRAECFRREQIDAQTGRRSDNNTDSTQGIQISENNSYESIDETEMMDIIPVNFPVNSRSSNHHSQLIEVVGTGDINQNLHPNRSRITTKNCEASEIIRPKTNEFGSETSSSGSDISFYEGYLNPYQPLKMETEQPRNEYSIITERKYMTILDPKINLMQKENCQKLYSSTDSEASTGQYDSDISPFKVYFNSSQPFTMNAKKPLHEYSIVTEKQYATSLSPKLQNFQQQYTLETADNQKHHSSLESRHGISQIDGERSFRSDDSSHERCLGPLREDSKKNTIVNRGRENKYRTILNNNQSLERVDYCESLVQAAKVSHTFKPKSPDLQHGIKYIPILKQQSMVKNKEMDIDYTDWNST